MSPTELLACFLALVQGSCGMGWTITVPSIVTGQIGLCVVIPCTYQYPRNLLPSEYVGIWYKTLRRDLSKAVYNSSNPWAVSNKYQLGGLLEKQDCSLVISDARWADSGQYWFRIELGEAGKYTYKTQVQLRLSGLTDKPTISLTEDIVEGRPVNITCAFLSKCSGASPTLNWTHLGAVHPSVVKLRTERRNMTWELTSVLNFTPSLRHQGKSLRCRLQLSGATSHEDIRLEIQYSPRDQRISRSDRDLEPAPEGSTIAVRCSVESRPDSNITWIRDNATLNRSWSANEVWLLLRSLTLQDEGVYQCIAINKHGTSTKSVNITVLYSPKETTVRVRGAQLEIREGDNITLTCSSRSNPPVTNYSWFRTDGSNRTEFVSSAETINLGPVTRDDDAWFYCRAQNALGSSSSPGLFISAEYEPEVVPHSNCTRGAEIMCICVVTGNPSTHITWQVQGENIGSDHTGAEVKVSTRVKGHVTRSTLTVKRRHGEFNALCVGRNRHGEGRLKFHLCSKDPLAPLWTGIIGGLCGALVAAAISSCACLLIVTRKKVMGSNQGQTPTARDGLELQTPRDAAADWLVSQNLPEPSGNAGQEPSENLLYCDIDYYKLPMGDGTVRGSEMTEYAVVRLSPASRAAASPGNW